MPVVSCRVRAALASALALIAALHTPACSHDDLVVPAIITDKPPRGTGTFHRVTFNAGNDLFPSWIAGSGEIAYSFAPSDRLSNDQCAGTIPAEGGTRRTLACRAGAASDSIASSNWPVVGSDARFVYVWEPLKPYPATARPDSALIYVQPLVADAAAARIVFRFPYVIPGVDVYTSATHLGWLNRDTVVAVAVADVSIRDCAGCAFRTVRAGRAVILLDLNSTSVLTIVAGTAGASAVTPGQTGHDFYYTVIGDSRVYHRTVLPDSTSVTRDFGTTGIARDPQLAGNRLITVVGGKIAYRVDPVAGAVQEDSGGPLHLVDLATGTDAVLPDSGVSYRHPALTAAGDRLVAEGWVAGSADLWFFRLP